MRFGKLTRGSGKAYQEVLLDADECHIRAKSVTTSRHPVPSAILKGSSPDKRILVIPVLDVTQVVLLESFDASWAPIGRVEHRYDPLGLALASKASTLLLGSRLNGLRNADARPRPDTVWLTVDRILEHGPSESVLRGRLRTLCKRGEVASEPHFSVLDRNGGALGSTSRILCRTSEDAGYEHVVLSLDFSLTVPREPIAKVLWARFSDGRDGFHCLEPWRAGSLQATWSETVWAGGGSPYYEKLYQSAFSPTQRELSAQRAAEVSPIKFSIVVPLFRTNVDHFDAMLHSVLEQTHPNFELLLIDASPEDIALGERALRASQDPRVRVIELEGNRGISLNTNVGIHAATGDFVCFLDHDDVLSPNCLFEYARAIRESPDVDLIYCDEDKLLDGHHVSGSFKPDFDSDLLLSHNYVTHFLCIRRNLLQELSDESLLASERHDGSQDHYLTLLASERARSICHIPKILYHWRIHAQSTALSAEAKPWAVESGRYAVQEALDRRGLDATVGDVDGHPNLYCVNYATPIEEGVSIVVVSREPKIPTPACKFKGSWDGPIQTILVSLGTLPDGFGFDEAISVDGSPAEARNLATAHALYDRIIFLDGSIVPQGEPWISRLLGPLLEKDVGITGGKLLTPDGLVHSTGVNIPGSLPRLLNHLIAETDDGYNFTALLAHRTIAVTADCMATTRELLEELGGFDERYHRAYDDIDFCLRAHLRHKACVFEPRVTAEVSKPDLHGAAAPSGLWQQKRAATDPEECMELVLDESLFQERWARLLVEGDPFYNRNFIDGHAHYQIKEFR